jgi:hypothetical protein
VCRQWREQQRSGGFCQCVVLVRALALITVNWGKQHGTFQARLLLTCSQVLHPHQARQLLELSVLALAALSTLQPPPNCHCHTVLTVNHQMITGSGRWACVCLHSN